MIREAESVGAVFARCHAQRKAAFIAFLTAGFPSLALTPQLIRAAAHAGADMIEVGFPYSDPLADGPLIAASSQRALANGVTFDTVLELAIRANSPVPLIAFCYYNPLFARGFARSAADLRSAGFAGLIVPDLPPEEAGGLIDALAAQDLSISFLVAPTTPVARAREIARLCSGFVYVAGRMGVTGTHARPHETLRERLDELRKATKKPLAVGIGISSPEDVARVSPYADGVIVGSALIQAAGSGDPVEAVEKTCAALSRARRRLT